MLAVHTEWSTGTIRSGQLAINWRGLSNHNILYFSTASTSGIFLRGGGGNL